MNISKIYENIVVHGYDFMSMEEISSLETQLESLIKYYTTDERLNNSMMREELYYEAQDSFHKLCQKAHVEDGVIVPVPSCKVVSYLRTIIKRKSHKLLIEQATYLTSLSLDGSIPLKDGDVEIGDIVADPRVHIESDILHGSLLQDLYKEFGNEFWYSYYMQTVDGVKKSAIANEIHCSSSYATRKINQMARRVKWFLEKEVNEPLLRSSISYCLTRI